MAVAADPRRKQEEAKGYKWESTHSPRSLDLSQMARPGAPSLPRLSPAATGRQLSKSKGNRKQQQVYSWGWKAGAQEAEDGREFVWDVRSRWRGSRGEEWSKVRR